jgi:hypothetical protein
MRWLYLVLLAGTVMSAQAQKESADTSMPEYFRDLPHYSIPGMDDSVFSKRIERYLEDSTYHEPVGPPQRKYYFLYKPDAKSLPPDQYKMWLDTYKRSLRKFIQDSIDYQQRHRRIDSLQHLIDSLHRMAIPTLVYRAGYSASKEAIFCWHSFSAIACSFPIRSIRRRSSSAVIS